MARRKILWLAAILVAFILAILLAIPKLNQHPARANPVREIQAIITAQVQYRSQFGRYARTLAELGPPVSGSEGPEASGLLPSGLTSGKKGGHIYVLKPTPSGYSLNVSPEKYGTDGRENFYADETGIIRERWSHEPATALDPPIGSAK